MADRRLRVVHAAPGGVGLAHALRLIGSADAVVTSWDERLLQSARRVNPPESTLEIVPWGELLGRILNLAGAPVQRLVNRGQVRALVGLAASDLSEDTAFERSCRLPGNHDLIVEALSELRSWSVEQAEMRDAAARAGASLGVRLDVLSRIEELVRDSMEAWNLEFATDRAHAVINGEPPPAWPLAPLVVIAGPEPHLLYSATVKWLANAGVPITMVVEAFPDRPDLFSTGRFLLGQASVHAEPCLAPRSHAALFTSEIADGGPALRVIAANDRLSECEWVVRDVLMEIESGCPEDAVTLVARSEATYAPLLQASASRLGLPLRTSVTVPLLATGFGRLAASLLEALARPDPTELERIVSNGYWGMPPEIVGRTEAALRECRRARGGAWGRALEWSRSEDAPPWLTAALAWREEASGEAPLSVWLSRLRTLVGGSSLIDAAAFGPARLTERDLRAQTVLQRAVADYAFASDRAGNPGVNLSGFVAIARQLWTRESVTSPGASRGVEVVTDAWSLGSASTVYCVGVNEGLMPRAAREDPVLGDAHRGELFELTNVRLTSSRERARDERDSFVRLVGSASRQIVLSYPHGDEERELLPSQYVAEAMRALSPVESVSHLGVAPPIGECSSPADVALRDAIEGLRVNQPRPVLTTKRAHEVVRSLASAAPSPSELGDWLVCPFRATFVHRLKLRRPLRSIGARIWLDLPMTIGLPARRDLDAARRDMLDILEERCAGYEVQLEPWELRLLRATGIRYIDGWIEREQGSRDTWPRGGTFGPTTLGRDDLSDLVPVAKGKTVRIDMKLAAVDRGNGQARAFVFASRSRGRAPGEDSPPEDQWLETGVLLAALARSGAPIVGVEIDAASGTRSIAWLPRPAGLAGNAAKGLTLETIADDLGTELRRVGAAVQAVVQTMEAAESPPIPGRVCEHCHLAEHCRSSPEIGDALARLLPEDGP